jgi:hypothetical protein
VTEMFLLFETAIESRILGFITEPLEVLIFGVGLVLIAVGLRVALKRLEKKSDGDVVHRTK